MPEENTGLEAQGGQVEETPAESQEQPQETDVEGFSMNDVPEPYREHVDKAVRAFQSAHTKKVAKQMEEWNREKQSYVPKTEYEKLQGMMQLWMQYPQLFQEELKKRGLIQEQNQNQMPEGWDSPQASQVRDLLYKEMEQRILQRMSPFLQTSVQLKAQQEAIAERDAENELRTVQDDIAKSGMPWSDDIAQVCIAAVSNATKQGKYLSLKDAYDLVVKPILQSNDKLQASKAKMKQGLKTLTPTAPGDKNLTHDDKLRSIINQLPVQDETL